MFLFLFSNRYYELLQSLSEWLPTIEESLQSIPEIEASSIKQINSLKNVYQVSIIYNCLYYKLLIKLIIFRTLRQNYKTINHKLKNVTH